MAIDRKMESYMDSKKTISEDKWRKRAPDKKGYWLRINAIQRPVIHKITESVDGELEIAWGWSGEKELVKIKEILHKLNHFDWMPFDLPV